MVFGENKASATYWESNTQVNQSVPITLQAETHQFDI
jgi:hypothetical protein